METPEESGAGYPEEQPAEVADEPSLVCEGSGGRGGEEVIPLFSRRASGLGGTGRTIAAPLGFLYYVARPA